MQIRLTVFYKDRTEKIDLFSSKKAIMKFVELSKERRAALAMEFVGNNHWTLGGFNKNFAAEIKDMQDFDARVKDASVIVVIEQLGDNAQRRFQCCVELH